MAGPGKSGGAAARLHAEHAGRDRAPHAVRGAVHAEAGVGQHGSPGTVNEPQLHHPAAQGTMDG